MSKLYDALRKLESERGAVAGAALHRLDAVRLDQFLDLQTELLRTAIDAETLAERLAHQMATLLRLPGVGIAVVEDGRYRLLAVHGAGRALFAADDGLRATETSVATALATGRPLVVPPPDAGPLARRIVLPFGAAVPGVVQLLVASDAALSPDDVALARVIAAVAGMAVGSAQRRRSTASDAASLRP